MPQRRDQRCDILQLEEALRRNGPVAAVGDEELGEGERTVEKIVAELELGQAYSQRKPEPPKAQGLTTEELRQAVIHTCQKLATSERRTCRAIGLGAELPAISALTERRRCTAAGDHPAGKAVRSIWLSQGHGAASYRRLAGQSQEGRAALA